MNLIFFFNKIKTKVHSQGGRAGMFPENQALSCFGIGYSWVSGLGGSVRYSGWSLMEAASNHLGTLSTRFVPELSWQPSSMGGVLSL